jgi:hypothetical protein
MPADSAAVLDRDPNSRVSESQKSQSQPTKFVPISVSATRSIGLRKVQVRRTTHTEGPMRSSFRLFADPQAVLKRNCLSQLIVSLSALASTALLLIEVVPTILAR